MELSVIEGESISLELRELTQVNMCGEFDGRCGKNWQSSKVASNN
jgi:hypothetical protein